MMVNAILAIFMRFALTRVASIAPFDLHMYYIIGFVCLRVCVSPVCVHTGLIRVACWIVRCSYIVRGCAWHLCSGLDAHLLWQVSRPPYSLNLAAVFRLAQACRGTWSLPRRGVGHGVASSHRQKCNDQAQQGAVQRCSFRSPCQVQV